MNWLLLALSFLPAFCMWEWIGPALWSHNSSAAFDAFIVLWVVAVFAPMFAIATWRTK